MGDQTCLAIQQLAGYFVLLFHYAAIAIKLEHGVGIVWDGQIFVSIIPFLS